ncbi:MULTISPECIES: DUF4386 domain-containing protein [unclassified Paenibacillus]|uniref:DUF4386 domain-containing protein n=1 Tax=unclassified Paenibacillus TaxID=185978 RepID=UPI0024054059|nr:MULTISPECIES: DUF4386 domain-containing protein [unclassified Paenibacillus]MDF9840631.1 hypothetical protein [Paenibacillus sp. PastF-2]MDF9847214.1 hypothetical protein [Paenibacillus sp. PastM-2]MDF9853785.1 hypothetical protein [Paenibacillus sp. PastF-1]MDH6478729.1 hypothetical protein [Paenibacillus sp. PastH-2]MDH6506461.1 hypothetical protein [Paenibacillus sp. PastM-3]
MTQDRRNGIIIGIFYIVAAVTSIIAVISYEPVLSEQWYRAVADGYQTKVLLGVINDLLLVLTAVGTAVMLFPYLRRWNEHLALAYLCFRFMEAVLIAVGVVSILGLLQLSVHYEAGILKSVENLAGLGYMLQAFHRWTSMLGPNFMLGVNTVIYSYLLFRTGIVPRPLALFGMVTAVLVFTAGLLEMFGVVEPMSAVKGLIALPVGVYEMSLAVWLLVKGFDRGKFEQLRG